MLIATKGVVCLVVGTLCFFTQILVWIWLSESRSVAIAVTFCTAFALVPFGLFCWVSATKANQRNDK